MIRSGNVALNLVKNRVVFWLCGAEVSFEIAGKTKFLFVIFVDEFDPSREGILYTRRVGNDGKRFSVNFFDGFTAFL